MPGELALRLLGGLDISQGNVSLAAFAYAKSQALLAYLAVTGRPHTREALASLLWGNASDAMARKNLRDVLYDLRRIVQSHLIITRQSVAFDRAARFRLDVHEFLSCFEGAEPCSVPKDVHRLREAIELYRGDLLEGLYVHDAPGFEEWLMGQRERLRQLALQALHELAVYHTERGEYSPGMDMVTRLLALDRLREDAHRQLMLLLARSGQREAALAQYETCRRILSEEIGIEPAEETTLLAGQIRMGKIQADPRPTRPTHNLPIQPTPLLGREAELAEIMQRLAPSSECRLLTLTGPGGIGKTRLGLQAAVRLLGAEYFDGVFLVALAPIQSPDLIVSAIARTLGILDSHGQSLMESIQVALCGKRLLLILDNFEHLLAAATIVSDLLAACDDLKVLATSREALHLRCEQIMLVSPLGLPPARKSPAQAGPDHVAAGQSHSIRYPAIQLFVERAQAVKPDFALTGENAETIIEICHHLDGLPLAIELAAARARLLTPQKILAQLDHRLHFLIGGARDLPARQQTLRSTMDWSYDLLTAQRQTLFRRLAVFAGSCTLETIGAVCDVGGDLDVLNDLQVLVDRSLVKQVELGGEPRFTMLETIREYAHEKLVESGEYEVLRARHLDFFAGLAEHVEPELHGPQQVTWFDRLELEGQDLRIAVEWASASYDRVETGLRLAGALEWFWHVQSHWHEWRARMSTLLSLSAGLSKSAARAKTMIGAGFLAWSAGDIGEARSILEESVALSRELGPADRAVLGLALTRLAYVSLDLDGKRVRSLCQESLAIGRETQNPWLVALSLFILGLQALRLHDDATAQPLLEESATVFRQVGDRLYLSEVNLYLGVIQYRRGDLEQASLLIEGGQALARVVGVQRHIATALYLSGELARLRGDDRQAEAQYVESIALWQEIGNRVSRAVSVLALGYVSLHQCDVQRARVLFEETLAVFKSVNEQTCISKCLAGLAAVAVAEGQPASGARLLSAARALLLVTGAILDPVDSAEHEHLALALHAQLDGATFDAAWAEGQAMTMEQAIAYALSGDT